jgi:hypothetical protein
MMNVGSTAAWVPDDDPERPWNDAADLAAEWIVAESKRRGVEPLLVTPTQSQWRMGPEIVRVFANRFEATTPRSARARFGHRPVLAYVPDYDTFHLAAGYARDSALAVVEADSDPVVGWAMEVGALNLITGEPTEDTRSEVQREEFERIHFYGNNGWTNGFGNNQLRRILMELQTKGLLNRGLLLGCMLAKGHNGRALTRLSKIIDSCIIRQRIG